ncbi:hypothetical protein [Dactylosporangium sp. NPDC051541]|uniref:hypothetical protein n=1 Tax=Dactylosporangium sp. NPDC051541 TaxID=3363977 RepID=UPI003787946F
MARVDRANDVPKSEIRWLLCCASAWLAFFTTFMVLLFCLPWVLSSPASLDVRLTWGVGLLSLLLSSVAGVAVLRTSSPTRRRDFALETFELWWIGTFITIVIPAIPT